MPIKQTVMVDPSDLNVSLKPTSSPEVPTMTTMTRLPVASTGTPTTSSKSNTNMDYSVTRDVTPSSPAIVRGISSLDGQYSPNNLQYRHPPASPDPVDVAPSLLKTSDCVPTRPRSFNRSTRTPVWHKDYAI